ncbi:MAG: InlB B-repeat-containing protein, partial [Candidatus Izemoplasmatales bacterium]
MKKKTILFVLLMSFTMMIVPRLKQVFAANVFASPDSTYVAGIKNVKTYDVNQDGYLDLLVPGPTAGTISWYPNNGSGEFPTEYLVGSGFTYAYDVCAGDYDMDGDVDIIGISRADSGNGYIRYYDNDGTNNFMYYEDIYSATFGYVMIQSFDYDNDTDLDLLVYTTYGQLLWLENDGFSFFTSHLLINSVGSNVSNFDIEAVDIDLDNDLDIIVSSYQTNNLRIFTNDGTNNFTLTWTLSINYIYEFGVIDFDQDGYLDIFTVDKNKNLYWYKGNGTTFTLKQTLVLGAPGYSVQFADYNNDGWMDIILSVNPAPTTSGIYIITNSDGVSTRTMNFEMICATTSYFALYHLTLADFDLDGDMDAVGVNLNKFSIYQNIYGLPSLHTVYFEENGGDEFADIEVVTYEPVWINTTPTKTGYEFVGFYQDEALTTMWSFSSQFEMPDHDITAYIKWSANPSVILFEVNGGTYVPNLYAPYESAISAPTPPTKTGYAFDGWYTDNELTTLFEFTTMPLQTTLYAKWTQTSSTISFEENGGTVVEDISGDLGTSVTAPSNPTKTGYTFGGWYLEDTFETSYTFSVFPNDNLTLYAKWNVNQYDLTFEVNGGTPIDAISFDYHSAITLPENPTKDGYSFSGWYTDDNLTINYLSSLMPVDGLTLYAKWNVNYYTLTFLTYNDVAITVQNYAFGTDLSGIMVPIPMARPGYTFLGWDIEIPSTMVSYNLVLKATYDINQYTIDYVDADGSVIQSSTLDYNTDLSTYTLPENPTKEGYTFTSWDTLLPNVVPDHDLTITALYDINSYHLLFDHADGETVDDFVFEFGTDLSSLSIPSVSAPLGYEFVGWDKEVPLTMGSANLTLTAEFELISYFVSYVDEDGTPLQVEEYHYSDDLTG